MYTVDELYVFLNYLESLPAKGPLGYRNVVLKKVPKELRCIDLKLMLALCEEHGYLKLLTGTVSDITTVTMTHKSRAFLSKQRRLKI